MRFLDLFHRHEDFDSTQGYDDVKDIVRRALDAEENFNLLFIGPPASAKTLFLLEISKRKDAQYFDGSNTTNRILEILEEERPKVICLDKIDKMPTQFQEKLLNFLESGKVKVDQKNYQCDFEIKGAKVFAAANDVSCLSKPLQSRFRKLYLPKYTRQQFLEVTVKVCSRLSENTAIMIGEEVWKAKGDIREVILTAKLVYKYDGPEEIGEILKTLSKYGDHNEM